MTAPKPRTEAVTFRRIASITSALAVAGIAAVASYSHMRGLALEYGQEPLIATLLPLSVDGMLVVATVALGDGRRYRWSAWVAFWVGVVCSIIANVLAAEPSAIARCISAWPAVAFLLVVEVITRSGRVLPIAAVVATPPSASDPATEVATEVATVPAEPAPAAPLPGSAANLPASAVRLAKVRARRPDMSQVDAAARAKVSERTAQRYWVVTTPPATQPDTEPANGRVPQLEGAAT